MQREWRAVAAGFAETHRVFAVDLPGFGLSDRPSRSYNAGDYVDFLDDFLRDVVGEPAALVASSLGAAYAIAVAFRSPEQVRSLLLVALGARPWELGLCAPALGTLPATVLCLVPSLAFVGWGLASGKLTPLGLFYLVVHNFLSNGFSEEFLYRGMVLSHLRAVVTTDWAIVIQAVVFALLHFHPNGEFSLMAHSKCPLLALRAPIVPCLRCGLL